jgi:hypothetical protein
MLRVLPTICLLLVATACFAQNPFTVGIEMPSFAQLSVVGAAGRDPGTLTLSAPTTAGAGPVTATDSSTALIYTVTVHSGLTRRIQARYSGTFPAGAKLELMVGSPSGGDGTRGTFSGTYKTLTTSDQDVVTGIGACYTGTTAAGGATLHYRLTAENPTQLKQATGSLTVTFTLTGEAP